MKIIITFMSCFIRFVLLLLNLKVQQQHNMNQEKQKAFGIIRNRINDLNRLKGKKKVSLKRFSKKALKKQIEDQQLMKSSLLSVETKASQIEMTSFEEPQWMMNYKDYCSLINEVEILQQEIAKQKRKKMTSIRQEKHDKVIQQFVQEATIKLNKCQKKLKEMQHIANFNSNLSQTNKKSFTSMLISMATNIRQQARKLRGQQQSQYNREKQLRSYTKDILGNLPVSNQPAQSWLQQEQFQQMEDVMMKNRNEQVSKIVQSIYSLNSIYKELQGLVIEQGSLLDRIDFNIDSTVESVKRGNQHLIEADKKMQSSCFVKLRLILICIVAMLLLIFLLKHA